MKRREELRRGVRDLIQDASRELDAMEGQAPAPAAADARPILRLVRDPSPGGAAEGAGDLPVETPTLLPRKGVCAAYFINRRCWEVPDAFCNTALQVCMLRECPVYHLHREELERRFAGKFAHFW